jgi:hypothetical protein
MRKLRVVGKRSNKKLSVRIDRRSAEAGDFLWSDGTAIEGEKLLLSYLLPTVVKEFFRQLEGAVSSICGERHSRGGDCVRWGGQPGSIYLGGQKVAITRPRVRDRQAGREQRLETYERF